MVSTAFAGTVELEAVGQVTSSTFASVPVGTTLTAFLFYDPAAAPAFTGPGSANYVAPQAQIFVLGSSTLTAPPDLPSWDILSMLNAPIGLYFIPPGDDGIGWVESAPAPSGPLASEPGYDPSVYSFQLQFFAPDADGVLSSTALPASFPAWPGQWTGAGFEYLAVGPGGGPVFSGTLESVVTITPEPGTVVLLVSFLIAASVRARVKTPTIGS